MYTEQFDQWLKTSKNLTTPLTELNKATAEIYRKIAEQHLEILTENANRISDQVQRLSTIKHTDDLLILQKDCLNENAQAVIESMQIMLNTTLESIDTFNQIGRHFQEVQPTPKTTKSS